MNIYNLIDKNPKMKKKKLLKVQKLNFDKLFNKYKERLLYWQNWSKTPANFKYFPDLAKEHNL